MIVTKTPLRVSLIGGGSDYPAWFNEFGGAVLGGSINKNVFVTLSELSKFSEEKFRFTYRVTESVSGAEEFEHPVVRATLMNYFLNQPHHGLNLGTFADIPGHSGMGSSSSFSVGLLLALEKFKKSDLVNPDFLASAAIRIEREILKEDGGWQDQYHAAFGGLRLYTFDSSGVMVGPTIFSKDQLMELSRYFVLVKVGGTRDSSAHASKTREYFKLPAYQEALKNQVEITKAIANSLPGKTVESAAAALFEAVRYSAEWKQSLGSSLIPEEVLLIGKRGQALGAECYKLLGAGGSGYILFGGDPVAMNAIRSHFPNQFMDFEFTSDGAQVFEI